MLLITIAARICSMIPDHRILGESGYARWETGRGSEESGGEWEWKEAILTPRFRDDSVGVVKSVFFLDSRIPAHQVLTCVRNLLNVLDRK